MLQNVVLRFKYSLVWSKNCTTSSSSSPMQWKILQENIGCSLHSLSHTRWSDRVDSVRPFAAHIPGIQASLKSLLQLSLTSETKAGVEGITKYVNSFTCIMMSCIWIKVLAAIDLWNKVLQTCNTTLDVEVNNIDSLLKELQFLKEHWSSLVSEAKTVANEIGVPAEFPEKCKSKQKRFFFWTKENLMSMKKEDQVQMMKLLEKLPSSMKCSMC